MRAITPDTAPTCLFCGGPEQVELSEIWSGHEFMVETCCEGFHESIVREMADDPDWARSLLRQLGAEALTGHRLRRLADEGSGSLVLDWQLEIGPIALAAAKRFIAQHHGHCRPPVTWRFGAGIWNGRTMLGVVTVGNPVAKALCGRGILEVNRLCVRRDVPRMLAWNAASMLYGWAAREAGRRGWGKVITYTRADEDGTSLRAAGWTREATVRGRGWHSARRGRSNSNGWICKVRWSRALRPRPRRERSSQPEPPLASVRDCLHETLFAGLGGSPPEIGSPKR